MPTIFFGHGNLMNALAKNSYTEGWASIGKSIPRPTAMLAVHIGLHYFPTSQFIGKLTNKKGESHEQIPNRRCRRKPA